MKYSILNVLIVLFCLHANWAQSQTHNKVSARTKKVLDSTYTSIIKKYKAVGLSLAIVDSGQIVYSMGYGFSDKENQTPATDSTIYRIGSCSKSFTSLSILQLHEKNKLNIEHSVKQYLPELKIKSRFNDNNQIYIKDMMCHVSGLPCDVTNGFFCDAPPDMNWLIAELNKQTTISPRRYKHAYSNSAYGLLGEVIARLGKTTYSNYVKQNIFLPLNMHSSYIVEDSLLSKRYAKGYVNKKQIKEPLIRDQAAGLIHSTVLDMSNYLLMYLNKGEHKSGYILSPDGIDEMMKNQIADITLPDQDAWGYGLYTKRAQIKKGQDSSLINIVQHAGDTYAYHADFGFIPELQVGVVVLTNSDKGASIRSANKLLKIYLKEARGIKLNTNYKVPLDSGALAMKKTTGPEDIKGIYNLNQFLIKVKSTKKIKFKQGPVMVVLNQKKEDPAKYKLKAVLLGIISIKIKDQLFTFENKAGNTYAKVILTANNGEEYLAYKEEPKPIPMTWKNAYGKYKLANKAYPCTNCPYGNPEGLKMTLKEEDGYIVLITKAKSPDMQGKCYLEVIDDKLLVTGGIGRNTGETVRVLENGNIYYSGFEFAKVD
ncbi:MAG: beta-lactamase family protein [Bacteroidia bacterium]|nr:beta-lactamase family protein [Bacteroidia bacterium]